jgi:hypothetical protein
VALLVLTLLAVILFRRAVLGLRGKDNGATANKKQQRLLEMAASAVLSEPLSFHFSIAVPNAAFDPCLCSALYLTPPFI